MSQGAETQGTPHGIQGAEAPADVQAGAEARCSRQGMRQGRIRERMAEGKSLTEWGHVRGKCGNADLRVGRCVPRDKDDQDAQGYRAIPSHRDIHGNFSQKSLMAKGSFVVLLPSFVAENGPFLILNLCLYAMQENCLPLARINERLG
jgi:hypothetical protein